MSSVVKPSGQIPKKMWNDIRFFSKVLRQDLLEALVRQGLITEEEKKEILMKKHLSFLSSRSGGNNKLK